MMTDEEIREFLAGKEEKRAVVKKVRFQPLKPVINLRAGTDIKHLDDVEITICVELGQNTLKVRDILNLSVGSVVELNKPAGDPIDVTIDDQIFARGEIMVYGNNFEIRISSILLPSVFGRDRG